MIMLYLYKYLSNVCRYVSECFLFSSFHSLLFCVVLVLYISCFVSHLFCTTYPHIYYSNVTAGFSLLFLNSIGVAWSWVLENMLISCYPYDWIPIFFTRLHLHNINHNPLHLSIPTRVYHPKPIRFVPTSIFP